MAHTCDIKITVTCLTEELEVSADLGAWHHQERKPCRFRGHSQHPPRIKSRGDRRLRSKPNRTGQQPCKRLTQPKTNVPSAWVMDAVVNPGAHLARYSDGKWSTTPPRTHNSICENLCPPSYKDCVLSKCMRKVETRQHLGASLDPPSPCACKPPMTS